MIIISLICNKLLKVVGIPLKQQKDADQKSTVQLLRKNLKTYLSLRNRGKPICNPFTRPRNLKEH